MVACGHMDAPLESTPETNDSSENMMEEATEPNTSSENTVDEPVEPENETERNNLELSDMMVKITSQGNTATFQLYDTTAAAEFYEQLPLELELSNFSDAQWIFYPPEKLSVTENEAYHDGKKGELSYYEPLGDVFMLYEDFCTDDNMHRLGVGLTGIDGIAAMSGAAIIEKEESAENQSDAEETAMQIQVEANGNITVFELNDSQAARELYDQLPLTIEVENYSNNEKIFYLPQPLDINDAPQADGGAGTLSYYAPWGDVVMFYGDFGSASGLYELGEAVSGSEFIEDMSGVIEITRLDS